MPGTSTRCNMFPDSKVDGTNMGPTWVLSAPDGSHVGPMHLAIRVGTYSVYTLKKKSPDAKFLLTLMTPKIALMI